MNQTKKHTTGKKLLALLLALIMTVSLLPMSVFAAEPGAEETPVVEGQTQPAAETGADDADQAQEPDADEANEDEAPVDEGEDTALPGDAEGDADDADAADDGIATFAATDATVQYKILHLDCGRKYFSKEWIIALLNEMSAAGYNQLQLAFGNKGLRFLLEDMSVTVDGKTYGNKEVTKAIQAGNKAYYDAREKNELTQTEMDAILAKAKELKIDIVPLFNTPFHMEAVITAMQQLDMTDVYYSEKGCLNLNNDAAKEFVTALMQKYVNYFAKKNCNFFNFGADEYKGGWNETFYRYANSIATMIKGAGMTARVFNDSFRGNERQNAALITEYGNIGKEYLDGVCYWYTGFSGNIYASARALNAAGYGLINTNKDYYYVVSNEALTGNDTYVFSGPYNENTWINHAKGFSNTTYNNFNTAGGNGNYTGMPIGSMFCVWSDNPGDKTETQIAKEIRMILRVMAARMDNKTTYSSSDVIVEGGFNANGTINGGSGGGTGPVDPNPGGTTTTVNVELKVGETQVIPYKTADDPVWGKYEIGTTAAGYDNTIANVTVSYETKDKTPVKAESITSGESYYIMDDTGKVFLTTESGKVTATTDVNKATKWKITAITDSYNNITGYKIQAQVTGTYANYYLTGEVGSGLSLTKNFVVTTVKQSSNWFCSTNTEGIYKGLYYQLKSTTTGVAYGALRYVLYDSTSSEWSVGWDSSNVAFYETTADQTTINFKGLKAGTTAVKVGDVTYNITVTQQKVVPVELEIGQTSDVFVGAADATITASGDTSIATANVQPVNVPGKTTRTLGDILTTYNTGSYEGVIAYKEGTDKYHYMKLLVVNGKADITDTTKIDEATVFTFNKTYSGCTIQAKDSSYYVAMQSSYGYTYTLTAQSGSYTWSVGGGNDFYYKYWNTEYYISYSNNDWELVGNWTSAGKGYSFTETTTTDKTATNITFTGVKPGETTYVIGGVTYHITVEAKTVNVTLEVGDSTTFNVGSSKISKFPDSNIAKAAWNDGVLTLAGMTVGNTECIVGDTKYVITVVAKGSTTGDSPLYVDLWVTNHGVLPDTSANYTVVNGGESTDTGARRVTLQYKANKFASSKGLSVSEFLPSTGSDTADSTRVAAYWKTRYLPQSTRQTTAGWTNKSGYGTDVLSGKAGGLDIERVRYYGGTWAYLPVGGTDWVDFTTAESDTNKAAVTKDDSGAQIAAFYMLKTKVTKEVTTYVTDWSDEVSNIQNKWIFGVALDYCVKFEGDTSTRYPATFGKTATTQSQWFNCQYATSETTAKDNGYTLFATEVSGSSWKGSGSSQYYRVINNIQAVETAQYEVYMITTLATAGDLSTVTDVDRQNYDMPDSIDYPDEYSKEKVIWAIDEKTATDSGLEKHDEYKQGGTPDVSRVVIQRGTGMLLTYYVRAKATTASKVTVEYYENRSNVKFYSFDIPTGTKIPNTFESFNWDEKEFNQTPYVDPWIGKHDICNSDGRSITINSDLALVSGLAAKYKAGGFTLTNIVRSEDSRTLKLYYDFTNSFTYVVDFGVPAKIERQSTQTVLKVTCGDKVLYDAENPTAKDAVEGENGKLYMTDVTSLYYELTTMRYSGEPDTFTLMFTYQNSDNTTTSEKAFNVTVIPASNVYYEDTKSFMTFENGQGVAENAKWTEEFDADKNAAIDSKQIAEIVGEANNNVYGYDLTYDNCTMFSLGRAHKVTVSADMVNNWNENSDAWPTAQFTFKGTGFDVISLTNDKSGLLTYKIEKQEGDGWTTVKQQFVINYYNYGYDAEKGWTKDTRDTLYQLPVIKADGLAYGTYRVTLTVAYGAIFDKTGENKYSIWLDGVRIYDPAGPDLNQTYAKDGEGWAQYIELRDKLAAQKDQRTALFIEDNSNSASIEDYKNYGPNHEVYLLNTQAIAFQLGNIDNVAKVQIGAKAPMGSATLTVNGTEVKPLGTATEMYYDITDAAKNDAPVIITNGSTENSSILSLTQLKITYKENPSTNGEAKLSILTAKQQQEVVQMVRAMYAPAPEPDPEPFAPERFEASWNRSTVKVGQKATLTVKTSEDVDAITVDGVTIDTYRTRTQRTGWGWNAKRVTYREFTYTITAKEAGTLNCSVTAFNAENTASEPITAALTVQAAAQRPSWGGWLGNLFGRWF